MFPTSFPESNAVLDKPPEMTYDECEALTVWMGSTEAGVGVIISCWKPTKAELDEINRTGRVWLLIYGGAMPPSVIIGTDPFSSASASSA
jgi:hypothetical protein